MERVRTEELHWQQLELLQLQLLAATIMMMSSRPRIVSAPFLSAALVPAEAMARGQILIAAVPADDRWRGQM